MLGKPARGFGFRDDREDLNRFTRDVIEHSHFPDPETILRLTRTPQALDPALAYPGPLVPQVPFQGVPDFGPTVDRQRPDGRTSLALDSGWPRSLPSARVTTISSYSLCLTECSTVRWPITTLPATRTTFSTFLSVPSSDLCLIGSDEKYTVPGQNLQAILPQDAILELLVPIARWELSYCADKRGPGAVEFERDFLDGYAESVKELRDQTLDLLIVGKHDLLQPSEH